jgi:predicted amidophosphoribosyltransferase
MRKERLLGTRPSERTCPDCGGDRPKNKSRCYECAEKQARQQARDRQRKHRRGE